MTSCRSFLQKLSYLLASKVEWKSKKVIDLMTVDQLISEIETLFKTMRRDPSFLINSNSLNKRKNFKKECDMNLLLYLENVDEILLNEGSKFRDILKKIYDNCLSVYVLISASELLNKISNMLPTIVLIPDLDIVTSVRLFLEKTGERQFDPREVQSLVIENP